MYETRSFSAAAQILDQNQSSISYTINTMRETFNDPLFVRQGNKIAATDRCEEIVSKVQTIIASFEALVSEQPFEPASATGMVTISCNYYERTVILPSVLGQLLEYAPDLKVRVIATGTDGERQLRRGECDILMSPADVRGDEIYRKRVCDDIYCCVMDRGNTLASAKLNLVKYEKANHVFITYGGGWRPLYLDHLEDRGVAIEARIDLPSLGDLEPLLVGTDLVATIPRRMAGSFSEKLEVVDMPLKIGLSIEMYWTSRTHRSPLFIWIRQLISNSTLRAPSAKK
ncbi:MAG: LysR family transcriptional regulator [Rhizobiaceae bacterium]|nr:LysR family transcriptional regulator [Rhizobiaceae bacterium]